MYARNTANADCNADSFDSKKIIPCNRYVYDQYYFDETLATKFDLICDNEYKSQLLHVIMMLGILIGSVVGGTLGDKFGRKLVMMVAAFIMCPVILGSGFIPNYGGKSKKVKLLRINYDFQCTHLAYAFLRWVACVCMPIIWVNSTVYMLESFTPKGRMIVCVCQTIPIHYFITSFIVYISRTWTHIHIGTTIGM